MLVKSLTIIKYVGMFSDDEYPCILIIMYLMCILVTKFFTTHSQAIRGAVQ